MRIAMLGTKGIPAKWGGIEKYVEEVGKRLVERGHEVTVFGTRWYSGEYREKTYLGMKICSVPTLHVQATDAVCNALLSSIVVMKNGYDIVHFHGHSSYCVMPLVRKAGKVAVITVHQIESAWDNPKYNSFGQKVIKSMFVKGVRDADRITTVANYLRSQIKAEFSRDSEVVPSGIEAAQREQPRIIREKYGLTGEDYFLFLGRIDPVKRVDWLLDLLPQLKAHRTAWKIVIAGGAQDSTTGAYLRRLQAAGAEEGACLFTGPVQGQEKAELLSNCLGFVMPSGKEGLPITLLEAMAYGRCCLASDIPAHREVIEDGISGLLFDSLDKADYAARFDCLLSLSEVRRTEMGKAAGEHVRENFDWDQTVDRLETVYSDGLNNKFQHARR